MPVAARLLSTSVTMIAAAQMAARRLAALRFFKHEEQIAASVVKPLASKQSSKPLKPQAGEPSRGQVSNNPAQELARQNPGQRDQRHLDRDCEALQGVLATTRPDVASTRPTSEHSEAARAATDKSSPMGS